MDFETGELHKEGLVIPFGKGIELACNRTEGDSHFKNERLRLDFRVSAIQRKISVDWPEFHGGRGIQADITLTCPLGYESMTVSIPIGSKRFFYNRKIACLPAEGTIQYGDHTEMMNPQTCHGLLDRERGVWEYQSFWNWASSSGFLPDGRTIGMNLGCGFGDLRKAGLT